MVCAAQLLLVNMWGMSGTNLFFFLFVLCVQHIPCIRHFWIHFTFASINLSTVLCSVPCQVGANRSVATLRAARVWSLVLTADARCAKRELAGVTVFGDPHVSNGLLDSSNPQHMKGLKGSRIPELMINQHGWFEHCSCRS